MDGQPIAADSKHHYPTPHWVTRSVSSPAVPRLSNTFPQSDSTPELTPAQCTTHLDLLPILFPQQSSLYQAKLLQYNKLIAPGRGGGLQAPPLPPILSSQPVLAGPRSRSSSKVSNKESRPKPSSQSGHGNRGTPNNSKADRVLITGKATNSKMPAKKSEVHHGLPPKPKTSASPSNLPPHPNSVPSTPHQHARKFSFGSRDQSPNANQSHSPRSVYSETNSGVPSLRPLPPRVGNCKFETGLKFSRRRIPYSIGTDPLDRIDLKDVQSRMTEDDERKLTTDMRELYDRLQPTPAVEAKRQKLVQKLVRLLNDAWPGHDIRVHLFGSSGNLLCSDDSDVDICITTPWKELEGVCMLADLLSKQGMEKVVCVSSAKVPIVKVWDPELQLSCDMNVNNTLALENTRMIKTYVEIDDRVRPLAMIIKHWTRRRIINDAAFGGTLSSYTWICMIIAFLQQLQPPVLPALHQRPHQKLPRKDGGIAAFADDINKLRGYGNKNKSSLGELLFQFFRFYAHEFDYSSHILSVRLGKLISKQDKGWHRIMNNQLCVEEPFNTNRNLGNTADDTAFRGIHLELRRAFDLIAHGKLDDCCAQYVYPKEEEKIFTKPSTVPRPVMVRSASQQQSSRTGRGGPYRSSNRHPNNRNNGSHNNNTSNSNSRRASSGVPYENNATNTMYIPAAYAMALGTHDPNHLYIQQPELAAQLSQLQLQENNLRFLQYTQSQAFAQHQALQHAQRMQGTTPQNQSSTERSRTSSFDTPPLSAPLRPELRPEQLYYYPIQLQQAPPFYGFPAYSSPSASVATEYRRTLHRSSNNSDAGQGSSGSTLRSHSQPASRPMTTTQAFVTTGQAPGLYTGAPGQHINGLSISSFIPDEGNDYEQGSSVADSLEESPSGVYYTDPSSPRRTSGPVNGKLAFGDLDVQSVSPSRLSSDQVQRTPESIALRSQSPSPDHQELNYQKGLNSAPLPSAPFASNHFVPQTAPLVVNGSMSTPPNSRSPRHIAYGETTALPNYSTGYDNPLHINQDHEPASQTPSEPDQAATPRQENPPTADPVVVNGSQPALGLVTPPPSAHFFTHDTVTLNANGAVEVSPWSSTSPASSGEAHPSGRFSHGVSRVSRPIPSPLIAQLDLATTGSHPGPNDVHHLSPVYETKSPSPNISRKLELHGDESSSGSTLTNQRRREVTSDVNRSTRHKSPTESPTPETGVFPRSNPRINGLVRDNGHVRGAKSESDNSGGGNAWQKPRGKKRAPDPKGRGEIYPQSEELPKNEADRKGG
ncbi:hypothetical protein F5Y16DRAFT_59487 [Xylariaceae sp. FL0255]|nr:hypothetical protein F5Y16DRAFT_59487 [Xylariaceae sp. FL0255]